MILRSSIMNPSESIHVFVGTNGERTSTRKYIVTSSCPNNGGVVTRRRNRNHIVRRLSMSMSISIRTMILLLVVLVIVMTVGVDPIDATIIPDDRLVGIRRSSSRRRSSSNSCIVQQTHGNSYRTLAFLRGGGGGGDSGTNNHGDNTNENGDDTEPHRSKNKINNNQQKQKGSSSKKKLFGPISRIFQMKEDLIHDVSTTTTTTTTTLSSSSSSSSADRSQLLAYLGGGAASVATVSPPSLAVSSSSKRDTSQRQQSNGPNTTNRRIRKEEWMGSHQNTHERGDSYHRGGTREEPVEGDPFLEEEEEEDDYVTTIAAPDVEDEYEYEYEYDEEVFTEEEDSDIIIDEYQGAFQLDMNEGEEYNDGGDSIDISSSIQDGYDVDMDVDNNEDVNNEEFEDGKAQGEPKQVSVSSNQLEGEMSSSFAEKEDATVSSHQEEVSVSSSNDIEEDEEEENEMLSSFVEKEGVPEPSHLSETLPMVEEQAPISSNYLKEGEEDAFSSFAREEGIPESSHPSDTLPMEEQVSVSSNYLEEETSSTTFVDESLPDYSHLSESLPIMEEQDKGSTDTTQISVVEVEIEDSVGEKERSQYVSSGWWPTIDKVTSLGLSTNNEAWRISQKMHSFRKTAADVTGMHGFLSGKAHQKNSITKGRDEDAFRIQEEQMNEEDLGAIRRRLVAIERARKRVAAEAALPGMSGDAEDNSDRAQMSRWKRPFAQIALKKRQAVARQGGGGAVTDNYGISATALSGSASLTNAVAGLEATPLDTPEVITVEDLQRRQRVKDIDLLMQEGQRKILELQIEKDDLQRRPNPFFNYTKPDTASKNKRDVKDEAPVREFNFPSDDLVSEYIDNLVVHGRLKKLNHTSLWFGMDYNWDEEEDNIDVETTPHRNGGGKSGGGSWLLRQTLGKGGSLGEKIGVAAEDAAYNGVCSSLMSILAQSLSALHGVNVMTHSDIRLFVEPFQDPSPTSNVVFREENYAQAAIGEIIRRGSKNKRKRKQQDSDHYVGNMSEDAFIQRDAVVETLISHCQISAPLLKLFPIAFQRALLGNIITLVTAITSDFCDGVQFEILGHQLSFSFKPITEADMIQHIGMGGFRSNHRRSKPEEFERAVRATGMDISKSLSFLDKWHERALGGDVLRAQIGNLIARVVLTLVEEVIVSAKMDLWSSQAKGPRIVGCLEYRTEPPTDGRAS